MSIVNVQYKADDIEMLRMLIEAERKYSVSYDEALEIGESLVSFFKILADTYDDESEEV